MAYVPAIDISKYQGNINFALVPQPIVMMRASIGRQTDPNLYTYYAQAKHQSGKAVGLYHFAQGGDPVAEANYFIAASQPLEQYDVFALDWEIEVADPVGWCLAFVNRVKALTGCWPLIYMDLDRLGRFNWAPVLQNCGLWIAAPSFSFDQDVPTGGHVYVMQQGATTSDPGIPDNVVDTDAWWGTIEDFKAYGYNASQPTPQPTPAPPQPTPTPVPQPIPAPPEPPTPVPTPPEPSPEPTPPTPTPPAPAQSWIQKIITWLKHFFGVS